MTREEALVFLGGWVAQAEPPVPCPVCVTAIFPRIAPKSQPDAEWRPGLRLSGEWAEWFGSALAWDRDRPTEQEPPPKPLTRFYEECTDCKGTGEKAPGSGPWHDCLAALEKAPGSGPWHDCLAALEKAP